MVTNDLGAARGGLCQLAWHWLRDCQRRQYVWVVRRRLRRFDPPR